MKRTLILFALVTVVAVVTAGCRRRTRHSTTEVETVVTVPGDPPPPGPVVRPADGIVGILTGDPDNEVDDATEDMVYDAVQRGDADDPIDF